MMKIIRGEVSSSKNSLVKILQVTVCKNIYIKRLKGR